MLSQPGVVCKIWWTKDEIGLGGALVIMRLGIAAAPWLMYPITKLVGVATYLYLLRCSFAVEP